MEAKELMINDFVSYINTFGKRKIGKITDLHHNESWETIYVDFCDQNPKGKSKITLVRPIPLTTEILKKNATSVTKDGCRTYYELDDNFAVKEFSGVFFFCELENALSIGKGEINDNTWMRMDYIHELQHALRLVGLSEIADNIKI